MNKLILKALAGQKTQTVPFWFMRQAGRYLPEYRELRSQAGGFLNMVYNPKNAAEVTVQPLRRFNMSAAILFSDILVIPQALGQRLEFMAGEGPKLEALHNGSDLSKLDTDNIDKILDPVYETVQTVRQKLNQENFDDTALIGFAGAPWTVATYMVEGGGSKTFEKTKKWAYGDPKSFTQLIDIITHATIHYLKKQIEAGAEVIQIFDSWSGVLNEHNFEQWVINPTAKIITALKADYPDTPIIGFPRGAGSMATHYANKTGITAIGLDFTVERDWARDNLQPLMPVQGNLDPVTLLTGGQAMIDEATQILETFSEKSFIFNLGHGVIKETPIEHVEKLSQFIRDYKN